MFSTRLDWSTHPNRISELLAEKRRRGEPVLDLTESNPTHASIEYPTEEIQEAFQTGAIDYQPEPFGLPKARAAVAQYYEQSGVPDVDPSRIVLTASTSEAYAYLFKLLADPGDDILTPRPSYPLFEYLACLESVRAVQYPFFYDHGWHLDGAALRAVVTRRTKAIVAVHPNNPTGSFLKVHELEQLVAVAREHDLAIISDEVFSDYWLVPDPDRVGAAAQNAEVLTFSLSGLSKLAGLPHMKLGWMVVGGPDDPRHAALRRLEFIADTYLSAGTPVQIAAPALLDVGRSIRARIRQRVTGNLDRLRTVLSRVPDVRLLRIEGGWSATLRVPNVHSEEEWVLDLLRAEGVLVQPGYFYDFDSEAYLVISLLTSPETFEQGIQRLVRKVGTTA